jgi:hypothetical protein
MEATGNGPSNNGNNNGNGNNGNNAHMQRRVRTPKSLPSRIDPSRVLPACFFNPMAYVLADQRRSLVGVLFRKRGNIYYTVVSCRVEREEGNRTEWMLLSTVIGTERTQLWLVNN